MEHPIAAVLRRTRRRDALREGDNALVLREVRLAAAVQDVQPLLLEQQP
jgi:hypothetical protein